MLVGNFIYTLALSSKWNFSLKTNYNQNELSQMQMRRYGAGVGATKKLLEGKLNLGADFNWFLTKLTAVGGGNTNLNAALKANWKVSNAHAIVLNWGYLDTKKSSDRFGEIVGTLGYQYTFARKPKEVEKGENGEKKAEKRRRKRGREASSEAGFRNLEGFGNLRSA
ncbi:MAG: hypothetical protein AAB316_13165 [Bacteroidota bacterium]